MAYQTNDTCPVCRAPLGAAVGGLPSGATYDAMNPNSPGFCGTACIEKSRGAAQLVVNNWEDS